MVIIREQLRNRDEKTTIADCLFTITPTELSPDWRTERGHTCRQMLSHVHLGPISTRGAHLPTKKAF